MTSTFACHGFTYLLSGANARLFILSRILSFALRSPIALNIAWSESRLDIGGIKKRLRPTEKGFRQQPV